MNLLNRIEKLEGDAADATASVATEHVREFEPNCICFPCKPTFWTDGQANQASSLKCPLHGNRFGQYEIVNFYAATWARDPTRLINDAPEGCRSQYPKALSACPDSNGHEFLSEVSSF